MAQVSERRYRQEESRVSQARHIRPTSMRELADSARVTGVSRPTIVAIVFLLFVALSLCAVVAYLALSDAHRGFSVTYDSDLAASQRVDSSASRAHDQSSTAGSSRSSESSASDTLAEEVQTLLVDVDGAVVTPGVYQLAAGARVADAIAAAGGLTLQADTAQINQASVVSDGEKIFVPKEGEATVSVGTASVTATSTESKLVNINTASIDELKTLNGVGDATAQAIIEERERGGPFSSVDDLMRVSGIGEKKLAKIRSSICV